MKPAWRRFDRHVADRHAAFHDSADRLARIFERIAGAAAVPISPMMADDVLAVTHAAPLCARICGRGDPRAVDGRPHDGLHCRRRRRKAGFIAPRREGYAF